VTLLVCVFSGLSVRHEPETHGYLVLRLLYKELQLHAQFPITIKAVICVILVKWLIV
jgi:hypothetical protein